MNRRDALYRCGAVLGFSAIGEFFAQESFSYDGAFAGNKIDCKAPGEVIFHVPARTGRYVGSPGIIILSDGTYVAKCDLFGPMSRELYKPVTLVFLSEDKGRTWKGISKIKGLFWASIFSHRGRLFMMGTDRNMGNAVIMSSEDNGLTWSKPVDERSGLLLRGYYHTAPVPLVIHNGRVWRAMEQASGPFIWNRDFRAFMMSAPVDAEPLVAANWTASEPIHGDKAWLHGRFNGWLEGNAVVTPGGEVVNVLRVEDRVKGNSAAMVRIKTDCRRAEFDPDKDFIAFPGGAKKFTIRFDPVSGCYWSLVNHVMDEYKGRDPVKVRNTQALVSSHDARTWTIRKIILHHPDIKKHAFQYTDWVFEGHDMIAVSRTAFNDGMGGAHNAHDANFLTFHRVERFREINRKVKAETTY